MTPEQKQKMLAGRKNKIKNNYIIDDKREKFLKVIDEEAPSCKKIFLKAYNGSLRAAINANCLACTFFDKDYIRHCPSTICGLWAVRPYQKKEKF